MASIRKRNGRWNVQIRRLTFPLISKTFKDKRLAIKWARGKEYLIDEKKLKLINYPSLKEIILRYIDEVSAYKRSYISEKYHLKAILKEEFINKSIDATTPQDLSKYRDMRLKKIKPSTVIREFNIIQHIYNIANKEWGYDLDNPCYKITKPKIINKRQRRISNDEYNFLVKSNYSQFTLKNIIEFAIETGMRRGEILNIKEEHIKGQTLLIPQTKNGHPRTIPLTKRALYILNNTELPFPYTPNALKLAWNRLKNKGNIKDLHFHDLRHEAISRFFEKGLSIPEVALISGHKDVRMLFRYTHLKPEDILKKL